MKKTGKRLLSVLLAALMLMTSFSAFSVEAFAADSDQEHVKEIKGITWVYKVKKGKADITNAFLWDYSGSTLTIPDKLGKYEVSAITCVGACEAVKTIKLGKNVTNVKGSALRLLYNATKITVDSKNKKLTTKDNILFNKKMTTLYVFPVAKKAKKYTVPKTVTKLVYGSFSGTTELSAVDLSKTKLKSIPKETFEGSGIKTAKFPKTLEKIGDSAFSSSCLNELKLPSKVNSVGKYAFTASRLKNVTIGKSLTKIGTDAFSYCKNADGKASLASITVEKGNKNYCSKNGVLFNKDKTVLIIYPSAKQKDSYTIPSSVKTIEANAFSLSKIKTVKFPSKLKEIKGSAFSESAITSFTAPKSLEKLGESAFLLSNIKSVDLSKSKVTAIDDFCFSSCSKLASVKLPSDLKKIGLSAFSQTAIKELTLPSKVKSIDNWAFGECVKLKSVDISKTKVTELKETFSACSQLKEVKLPKTLEIIGYGAFYGTASLEEITIPASVKRIEYGAFSDSEIQEITIKGEKTKLEDSCLPSNDGKTVEIFDEEGNTVDEIYLCYPRIKAPENSKAHDFATEYSYLFEAI